MTTQETAARYHQLASQRKFIEIQIKGYYLNLCTSDQPTQ